MKIARTAGAAALLLAGAALCFAADVVVLRGGVKIELKGPWVQQGNMALLTQADGRLLSVPVSEIDLKATAAAKAQARPALPVVAPPETPAQAARMGRGGPKARVKLTDRDVGHYAEFGSALGEKKEAEARAAGGARLEIADYTQERAGGNLVVRGSMRNAGGTSALNARLMVSALDEKGQPVASAPATLSNGLVEPFASVSFSAGIAVGADKLVTQIRFAPQWIATPPPAPEGTGREPAAANGSSAPGAAPVRAVASQAPQPQPTPWGRGLLYAPPPPASAPSTAPADGKTGYIPGAASPDSQPKPPQ